MEEREDKGSIIWTECSRTSKIYYVEALTTKVMVSEGEAFVDKLYLYEIMRLGPPCWN